MTIMTPYDLISYVALMGSLNLIEIESHDIHPQQQTNTSICNNWWDNNTTTHIIWII
jgi:hypothetical protein